MSNLTFNTCLIYCLIKSNAITHKYFFSSGWNFFTTISLFSLLNDKKLLLYSSQASISLSCGVIFLSRASRLKFFIYHSSFVIHNYISLPTASAIFAAFFIKESNFSGVSDCEPSDHASCGFG